jgi:multidrug efflux pump subunit AcrA (membrane-fusion protein)
VGIRLPRGRKRVWWSAIGVVVVAAGVVGWLVFWPGGSPAAEPLTAKVTSGPQRQTVDASGTVQPARRADLQFAVSGKVTSVPVAEGDTVTAGQALATVDDELLRAEVDAAESSLDAAQAKQDDDSGASDTQASADEASVVSARSRLSSAREALSEATLRSTIAGTVAAVDLAVGDEVTGSSGSDPSGSDGSNGSNGNRDGATSPNAAPQDGSDDQSGDTTPGITVVSTGRFVVDADVASSDVAKVEKGQQVEVTPVDATEPVAGTVRSVGLVAETADSGAATFPVTIDVTGDHDDLYAGSSATVTIVIEERDDVLTVPSAALHGDGDSTYVYKIVDGKRVRTPVRIGTAYGPMTEVKSGLAEGDEVELAGFRLPGGGGRGGTSGNGGDKTFNGPIVIPDGGGKFPGGAIPGGK